MEANIPVLFPGPVVLPVRMPERQRYRRMQRLHVGLAFDGPADGRLAPARYNREKSRK